MAEFMTYMLAILISMVFLHVMVLTANTNYAVESIADCYINEKCEYKRG